MKYKYRHVAMSHFEAIIKRIVREIIRAEASGRLKLARSNGYVIVPLRRYIKPRYYWQYSNVRKVLKSIINKFPDIPGKTGIKIDRRGSVTLLLLPEDYLSKL